MVRAVRVEKLHTIEYNVNNPVVKSVIDVVRFNESGQEVSEYLKRNFERY